MARTSIEFTCRFRWWIDPLIWIAWITIAPFSWMMRTEVVHEYGRQIGQIIADHGTILSAK